MRKIVICALLAVSVCTSAFAENINVNFENKSAWAIHEMYLSTTKTNEWGPDQLGNHTIEPGESFELRGVPVGKYDFKLVDEDGDECVVSDIKVLASEHVVITDKDLLGCQAATEEEGGE